MKRINSFMLCIGLMLFASANIRAQQATAASGGDATGSGGTVSYTIGQMDYITASGSGGSMSEGVQFPYTIDVATGVQEKGIELSCAINPNPTADFVVLSIEKGDVQNMSYGIYSVSGHLIAHEKLNSKSTTIPMNHYADAMYMVKVFNDNKEVKSFKVIKNK